MGIAEGKGDGAHVLRMFVQQIPEFRGRSVIGRDGQEQRKPPDR